MSLGRESSQILRHYCEIALGGSVICDPYGNVLAGPLRGEEGLVIAEVDLAVIPEARYDLDAVGHYSRPDVFQLSVDEGEKRAVRFE